jgi:hypothetical protein
MVVDVGDEPAIESSEALKKAVQENFINHVVSTPYGSVEIPGVDFQRYLALPTLEHGKKDLMACFDAALERAHQGCQVSVTIACRSQLNRPYLLERALLSFAAAQEMCPPWLSLEVAVLSDRDSADLVSVTTGFQAKFPGIVIKGVPVKSRSRETSRIDHLIEAVRQLNSDYIWFIDDDDFVMPGALKSLARTLVPNSPLLLIGTSEVLDEQWKDERLDRFQMLAKFPSSRVFEVFKGENYVPICSMLIPTKLARERCAGVEARGEYLEDYFLLLRLLTAPKIEVETVPSVIAGISLRGSENTVRQPKQRAWSSSYGQFVGEILRSDDSANPLLWQLARGK